MNVLTRVFFFSVFLFCRRAGRQSLGLTLTLRYSLPLSLWVDPLAEHRLFIFCVSAFAGEQGIGAAATELKLELKHGTKLERTLY